MTGQNGARLGIWHWGSSHVQDRDILISRTLKEKGYITGISENGIWACSMKRAHTTIPVGRAPMKKTSARHGGTGLTSVLAPRTSPRRGIL